MKVLFLCFVYIMVVSHVMKLTRGMFDVFWGFNCLLRGLFGLVMCSYTLVT